MTKAICTDLDGTLLCADSSISPYTLSVLGLCRERGLRVVAATARPIRAVRKLAERVCFDAIITWNGARIFIDGEVIENVIARPSANAILREVSRIPGATVSVETDKGFFANMPIPTPGWTPIVLRSFDELPEDAVVYKILASGDENLYDAVDGALTEDVYRTVAGGDLVQIMSRRATKRNAIAFVLQKFGISREDAVFFGDDNDDVEALQWCGTGVAVRNAIPAVLAAADVVAARNDDDGVAKYIDEVILGSAAARIV